MKKRIQNTEYRRQKEKLQPLFSCLLYSVSCVLDLFIPHPFVPSSGLPIPFGDSGYSVRRFCHRLQLRGQWRILTAFPDPSLGLRITTGAYTDSVRPGVSCRHTRRSGVRSLTLKVREPSLKQKSPVAFCLDASCSGGDRLATGLSLRG
jgi:hypothetical protein